MGELVSFENGTEYVISLDEPITFLSVLSISAIITTVSLFFCGIPICVDIFRRKSTDEISGFPFIMGLLGGSFWLRYGFLKFDLTMITVNVVGVTLMLAYTLFYIYFTVERSFVWCQMAVVGALISSMLFTVQIYGISIIHFLGFVCMSFNIVNFGAPLAGVRVVLRKKCCDSLPLPLCTANLLVSSQWCLYGLLVDDIYIVIPNSAGVVLAVLQLSLFLIFPRKIGATAPLASCLSSSDIDDVEKCRPAKCDLPDAKTGFVSALWGKNNLLKRPISSVRTPKKKNLGISQNNAFGTSLSNSTCTTCTGTTSVSHIPGDAPTITITSSDNEIDEDDVNVETPLNSPSFNSASKQIFQFDRIPEVDFLEASWIENELRRAQSAPEITKDTPKQ